MFTSWSSALKQSLILLIRSYQLTLGCWLIPSCKYHPCCSEYALQALKQKGVIAGLMKTVGRLLRCHPFNNGGCDPVS